MKYSTQISNLYNESQKKYNLDKQIQENHYQELTIIEEEHKKALEAQNKSTIECNSIFEKEVQPSLSSCTSAIETITTYQENELNSANQAVDDSLAFLDSIERENYNSLTIAVIEEEYKEALEAKNKSALECNSIFEKENNPLRNECSSSREIIISYQSNEINSATQALNNSRVHLASIERENYNSLTIAVIEEEYKQALEAKNKSALECNSILEKENNPLRNECSSSLAIITSYQDNELNSAAQALNDWQLHLASIDRDNYDSLSVATIEEEYRKALEAKNKSALECNSILEKENNPLRNECSSSLAIITSYQDNELTVAAQAANNSLAHLDNIDREKYKSVVNEPIKHRTHVFVFRGEPYYTDNWVTKYDDARFLHDLDQLQTRVNIDVDLYNKCKDHEAQLLNAYNKLRAKHEEARQKHIKKLAEHENLTAISDEILRNLEELRAQDDARFLHDLEQAKIRLNTDIEFYNKCADHEAQLLNAHDELLAQHEASRQKHIKKLAEHENLTAISDEILRNLEEFRAQDDARFLHDLEQAEMRLNTDIEFYNHCKDHETKLINEYNELSAKHEEARQKYIRKLAEHENLTTISDEISSQYEEMRNQYLLESEELLETEKNKWSLYDQMIEQRAKEKDIECKEEMLQINSQSMVLEQGFMLGEEYLCNDLGLIILE